MKEQYVTRTVKEKIDNLLQQFLWKDIIEPAKLKDGEMIAIKLRTDPDFKSQLVRAIGSRGLDQEEMYTVMSTCNADLAAVYIGDENREILMLANESDVVAERFAEMTN